MWISRSNIPPGAHTKAKFTLATSAGCTTRPEHTHAHAHIFTQFHTITHSPKKADTHIFYNSKPKLWPPVESLTVAADLLFSCLTRWLTEALRSLLLKLSHKQSPCRPQCSTPACHDGLFSASSLLRFHPGSWQEMKLMATVLPPRPQPERKKHNRQSSNCGKITTQLIFQVPVWIMNQAAEI